MGENKKYWLAFAGLKQNGSVFVQRLFEHFQDIEIAWNADISELIKVEGLTKKQLDSFMSERKNISPDECFDYITKKKIDFLSFDDINYPALLKNIYNPPMTLFFQGNFDKCNLERTFAVVGSRKASESSKEILSKIIDEFRGTDVCIVSGLAAGIDTIAHASAIKSNLSTIAVLGGGFDHVYPSSNKKLFEQIKEKAGVVISEYWPTFEPIAWRFPHRNRIVSGLSKGTLVAEAAIKSGALITANLCLEHGRELMCIPGLLTNPNTAGIYKLLKDGASLITSAEDIMSVLSWETTRSSIKPSEERNDINLTDEEKVVIDCISRDSMCLDEIILKTNLNIGDLMVILTRLELRGLIKQTDGEKFISLLVH